jgi:16S rRNA (cytosine967-C5)-methyltransferase
LIFLDKIPAHAAINDAVNLVVQKAKKTSAKGFVNAVLRRFTREKIELAFADEIERVSVETSHPRWLIEKWTRNSAPKRKNWRGRITKRRRSIFVLRRKRPKQ